MQLFAESIGATEDNGQFSLIPVRPDWSDGSELLGYTDIKGDFIEGQLIIKPVVKVDEDFAENLLEELIAAGFSGEELVAKFKEMKQMVLNGEKPYL